MSPEQFHDLICEYLFSERVHPTLEMNPLSDIIPDEIGPDKIVSFIHFWGENEESEPRFKLTIERVER